VHCKFSVYKCKKLISCEIKEQKHGVYASFQCLSKVYEIVHGNHTSAAYLDCNGTYVTCMKRSLYNEIMHLVLPSLMQNKRKADKRKLLCGTQSE
jgi:hypothetical protein